MRVLEGLQPAAALGFFETLCAIPHGSRDTKAISDYCVRFAQAHLDNLLYGNRYHPHIEPEGTVMLPMYTERSHSPSFGHY